MSRSIAIPLGLQEKAEWEDYFLMEQEKAKNIQQQIKTTDDEVDQMVYNLYNLTEEEINIVESSTSTSKGS